MMYICDVDHVHRNSLLERRKGEVRRTSERRSSQNNPSTHSGEYVPLWMLLEPASALEDEVEPYGD